MVPVLTLAGKGRNGLGLKNIEERVQAINGSLSIDSLPGKGTSIYIELEIPEETETVPGKKQKGKLIP